MLRRLMLGRYVSSSGIISMACIMVMITPFATLVGCTEGDGNSVSSGLSTSAGATAGPSSIQATDHTDAATGFTSDGTLKSLSSHDPFPGADSVENVPMVSVTSTPSEAIVRLNWLDSSETDSFGYHVYYGKQPAREAGSCTDYETNQAVDAPPATIAGLEHDTIYYFAVKHFNDSDDACSEEIVVATPPAQR